MNATKIPATAVAVATYVVVAGIFTQGGVILEPAAAHYHVSLAEAASLFSSASAGNLAGIVLSTLIFAVFSIRRILIGAYLALFAGVATIVLTPHISVAYGAMFVIGLGVGTGLSAGAVILAKLYVDRARAVAFLSTDCAFSGTGFVIPAVAAALIAAGWIWQSGYLIVAAIALVALVAALIVPLPATTGPRAAVDVTLEPRRPRAFLTIGLFAAGITAYLTGQTSFTLWAPTVLHDVFHLGSLQAGGIVSSFFGPSSLGLVTAALVVSRVPPRAVLLFALGMGVALSLTLALVANAHVFFLVTFAFGFTTTCMFKIMISIGSEQLPGSPPSLVTFLLLCSGIGSTIAPLLSGYVVKTAGLHASLWCAFAFHTATAAIVIAALLNEALAKRDVQRRRSPRPARDHDAESGSPMSA